MPQVITLYSANSEFQRLEVLKRNRNKRHKYNEFFVEGVRNINEAIKNGWRIAAYIYPGENGLFGWGKEIIHNSTASVHYVLSEDLMEQLSDKEDTSELLAVVSMPNDDLSRIQLGDHPLVIVFDRPSNKGNLGTIIRSCDALGCQGLIITGHAVDLYDPETIRSTMGSLFNLPIIRLPSHAQLIEWIAALRDRYGELQVVGTSAHATEYIEDCNFTKPTIVLVGNETHGLSHVYKEMSDVIVKIRIGGSASSLNVACATAILLYEVTRQRRS